MSDPPPQTPPEATPAENGFLDRRRARGGRTYQALVHGLRECLLAGEATPTTFQIAARAGVSRRAVFRHCAHVEELYAAVVRLENERLAALERRIPTDLPLSERIRLLATQRSRRNEELTPIRRATRHLESSCATIREQGDRSRRRDREEARSVFAPELARIPGRDRRGALAAITGALTWATWEELRRYEGLSERSARKVVERLVTSVVSG